MDDKWDSARPALNRIRSTNDIERRKFSLLAREARSGSVKGPRGAWTGRDLSGCHGDCETNCDRPLPLANLHPGLAVPEALSNLGIALNDKSGINDK
jgi:hypothetical protein